MLRVFQIKVKPLELGSIAQIDFPGFFSALFPRWHFGSELSREYRVILKKLFDQNKADFKNPLISEFWYQFFLFCSNNYSFLALQHILYRAKPSDWWLQLAFYWNVSLSANAPAVSELSWSNSYGLSYYGGPIRTKTRLYRANGTPWPRWVSKNWFYICDRLFSKISWSKGLFFLKLI